MSDDDKSAAKLIEVATKVIEEKCQSILALSPSESDLAALAPHVRSELLAKIGPPSGPIGDIRAQLRELRRLAEKLRR
jgi:hypothetical protein